MILMCNQEDIVFVMVRLIINLQKDACQCIYHSGVQNLPQLFQEPFDVEYPLAWCQNISSFDRDKIDRYLASVWAGRPKVFTEIMSIMCHEAQLLIRWTAISTNPGWLVNVYFENDSDGVDSTVKNILGFIRYSSQGAVLDKGSLDIKSTDALDSIQTWMPQIAPTIFRRCELGERFTEILPYPAARLSLNVIFVHLPGSGVIMLLEQLESSLLQRDSAPLDRIASLGNFEFINPSGMILSSGLYEIMADISVEISTLDSFLGYVHEEDRDWFVDQLETALLTKRILSWKFRNNSNTENPKWFWVKAQALEGNAQRVIGVIQDITKDCQQIESLSKAKSKYEDIFRSAPIAVVEEDFSKAKQYIDSILREYDGSLEECLVERPYILSHARKMWRITNINTSAVKLLGLDSSDSHLIERDLTHVTDITGSMAKKLVILMSLKKHLSYEDIIYTKSGRKKYVEINLSIAPGSESSLNSVYVSLQDISQRKIAQRELEKRTEKLIQHRSILLQMSNMNWEDLHSIYRKLSLLVSLTLNVERVSIWNISHDRSKAVCQCMYALSSDSYSDGQIIYRVESPRYFEAIDSKSIIAIDDVMISEDVSDLLHSYLIPSGISSMMDVFVRTEEIPIGIICLEHTGIQRSWTIEEQEFASSLANQLSLGMEKTRRKHIEDQLYQEDKIKSVGMLAGGIAHDFNNILLGVMANLSMLRRETKDLPRAYEYALEAENAVKRAAQLTQQLLTFSKGGHPIKEDVPVDKLVSEVVRFDLSGSQVKPIFEINEDLWEASLDPVQFQQVISNITINAKQAMPDGGHFIVSIENVYLEEREATFYQVDKGNYLKITLEDEGIGIPPENLSKVFDPYFSTKPTGNGLGLPTSFAIIEKHDGRLTVSSEMNLGTTFTILLPAIAHPNQRAGNLIQNMTNNFPNSSSKRRALIMDDEDMLRKVVSNILKENGYWVDAVPDGLKVIELYQNALNSDHPYDVVIVDLTVPGGMGGKEALDRLLQIDPYANVIVSSGYADDPIMSAYKSHGFKGIIAKPYKMEDLLRTIEETLMVS